MSHPTFLDSAPYRRMPDGSQNEWKAFWGKGPELEANGALPLLWLALFRQPDIAWARMVDDEDADSEGREDLAEFGETTYPYLVTSVEEALATFAARRHVLVDRLGERYTAIVDEFSTLIKERYAPFVLLRTSGLPDVSDSGPMLRKYLSDFDALAAGDVPAPGNSILAEIAYFHKYSRNSPVYLLSGGDGGTWPPAALQQQFSQKAPPTARKKQGIKPYILGWLPGTVVGLTTVATFLYTKSAWAAAACFCVVCLAFVWAMRR